MGVRTRAHMPALTVARKGRMLVLRAAPGMKRRVMVFDALGSMVCRATWKRGSGTLALDTKGWPGRLYLIQVESGNDRAVKKLCAATR